MFLLIFVVSSLHFVAPGLHRPVPGKHVLICQLYIALESLSLGIQIPHIVVWDVR